MVPTPSSRSKPTPNVDCSRALGQLVPSTLQPGQRVAGCVIERELGRGSMGVVYLARRSDGTPVALKMMVDPDGSRTGRERFRRECEALEAFDHPGIVRLLGSELEATYPCLVLEFVEGRDLAAALEAGDLDLDARLDLVAQVCRGAHYAHCQGTVHRDLKPANVLIDAQGRAKITDFGLVRSLDRSTRLTRTGAVMGTPGYMSPEQVCGRESTGPATDIFSLGAILYEAITGALPFDGDTAVEVIARIVSEPPEKPSSVCAWAGPQHDAVVLRALAKAPADRYPSALALAEAIERLRARGEGRATPRLRGWLGAAIVLAAALGGAALALKSGERPLSREELQAAGDSISADCRALLSAPGLLSEDAGEVRALLERQDAVLARAPEGEAPPTALGVAATQLTALRGLLVLSEGDTEGASAALRELRGGETSELQALRGGIAALTTAGDPRRALRDLSVALDRGVHRLELRAWRLRARARVGVSGKQEAEDALRDAALLRRARPLTPSERALGVRARLSLRQFAKAQSELDALRDPPVDLAWAVFLATADRGLGTDPASVLRRLQAIAPQERLDPRREAMRGRALQPLRSLLVEIGGRHVLTEDERSWIVTRLRLAYALWPEDPPADLLDVLLSKATSFKGNGDLALAMCLGDVCPDNKAVQLSVGSLAQRKTSPGPRRACLPYLRRAIELEQDASERLEIQVALCILVGDSVVRYPKALRLEESEECVALATELLPVLTSAMERAEVLNARSNGLLSLGDSAGALRDVDEAIELAQEDSAYRLTRMRTYLELGRKADALDDAQRYAMRRAERKGSGRTDLACVVVWTLGRELGEEEMALEVLRVMLRGRPTYVGWRARLAYLQLRAGEIAQGQASFAEASRRYAQLERYRGLPDLGRRLKAVELQVRARGADALPEVEAFVDWLEAGRTGKGKWAIGY